MCNASCTCGSVTLVSIDFDAGDRSFLEGAGVRCPAARGTGCRRRGIPSSARAHWRRIREPKLQTPVGDSKKLRELAPLAPQEATCPRRVEGSPTEAARKLFDGQSDPSGRLHTQARGTFRWRRFHDHAFGERVRRGLPWRFPSVEGRRSSGQARSCPLSLRSPQPSYIPQLASQDRSGSRSR